MKNLQVLTDAEISEMVKPYGSDSIMGFDHVKAFTRAIEAAILAKLGAMELPDPSILKDEELGDFSLNEHHYPESTMRLVQAKAYAQGAAASIAMLDLLGRLEKVEEDAKHWNDLCYLVNEERACVTFYGRVDSINTGLQVNDSGDLYDELNIAMAGLYV
jgi:hypothetical protein